MSSPEIYSRLAKYWENENVVCLRAPVGGVLVGTELGKILESVGMPVQDWWLFRFAVPTVPNDGRVINFGTVGEDWKLIYRPLENICLFTDGNGAQRFANSSFLNFMEMLALFDGGYRRIQRDCPGDSDADWDRGDVIILEMETSMRIIDPQAFEKDTNFWPELLIDING